MAERPITLTIELDPPIEHDGGKILNLELREPAALTVLAADRETAARVAPDTTRKRDIVLVALVANVSSDVIRKLPVTTFNKAAGFLRDFVDAPIDDAWAADRPDTLDMPIEPPIDIGNARYDILELREPSTSVVEAAELELRNGMNSESLRRYQIKLVTGGSNVPAHIVNALRVRQLDEATRYLQGFINPATDGQKIGEI